MQTTRHQFGREDRAVDTNPARMPEIRVVRYAATQLDQVCTEPSIEIAVQDVGGFIDHLGRRNRPKGTAMSLGSVAVTLLSEREVQRIIADTYKVKDRRHLLQIRRGLASSVRSFVRSREADKRYERAQELAGALAYDRQAYDPLDGVVYSPLSDIWVPDETAQDGQVDNLSANQMSHGMALRLSKHPYGVHVASVLGLEMVASKKWALRLGEEVLCQERAELIGYLRREENMNVRGIGSDYEPHATVFKTRDDLPDSTSLHYTEVVPRELVLLPVGMET